MAIFRSTMHILSRFGFSNKTQVNRIKRRLRRVERTENDVHPYDPPCGKPHPASSWWMGQMEYWVLNASRHYSTLYYFSLIQADISI